MNEQAATQKKRTMLSSLNQALHSMMEEDSSVIVLGEDILDPYGGAFKVTNGLSTRFPGRVLTTPISEGAITGVAVGMALRGLKPVAEIMFGDFLTLAADQLINHAAKFRWMYNDGVRVPLVVRTPMGGRRGYGPTHSQSLEKHFLGVPGLWVVAPHVLGEPGQLLQQAALGCPDPVLFIEHKTSYGTALLDAPLGLRAELYCDDESPFPTTLLSWEGAADGLICCYGGMTALCLEAIERLREEEGLAVNLAVFTQLSPVPASHLRWVRARQPVELQVYVEEGGVTAGWSAELIARVEELRAQTPFAMRHERIAAIDEPLASSRELEQRSLPQVADIMARVVACF
jgi:pyruvate/2-oxoglutarate/acetoin dehydrogenase E1 component